MLVHKTGKRQVDKRHGGGGIWRLSKRRLSISCESTNVNNSKLCYMITLWTKL